MGCGASSFDPAEIVGGCGNSGTHRGKLNPFRRRRGEQDTPSTKQLLGRQNDDVEPSTENNARPSVSPPRLSVKAVHRTPLETVKLPEPAVVEEDEKCSGDVKEREVRNDDVAYEKRENGLMMCPGSPSFRVYCVDRSSCVSSDDGVAVREGNGLNGNEKDSKDHVGGEWTKEKTLGLRSEKMDEAR